jgi:hypothetical protein
MLHNIYRRIEKMYCQKSSFIDEFFAVPGWDYYILQEPDMLLDLSTLQRPLVHLDMSIYEVC